MSTPWPIETVDRLRGLCAEQHSYGLIAQKLATGHTRNAVIGKASRLGITNGRSKTMYGGSRLSARNTSPRKPREPREYKPRPKQMRAAPRAAPRVDLDAPVSKRLSVMQLNPHTCKWPEGGGPYTFCGTDPFEMLPYCEYHSRLAYRPPEERRRSRSQPHRVYA